MSSVAATKEGRKIRNVLGRIGVHKEASMKKQEK